MQTTLTFRLYTEQI